MKYSITSQQQSFFQANQAIEFSECFTEQERKILKEAIQKSLRSRKKTEKEVLSNLLPEQFVLGRDLWREEKELFWPILRKVASIVALLTGQKRMRIGFDQILELPFPAEIDIHHMASIQGIFCFAALLIDEDVQAADCLPKTAGSLTLFQDTALFDLQTPRKIWLIGFAYPKSRYVFEPNNVHTHFCKRFGLGFGDALSESTHPLL
jgi:hypothetical protein